MAAPTFGTPPMPFRFEYDSANKIFLVRFEGRVTDEMVERFYHVDAPRVMAKLDFRGSIVDFSGVTSMEMTPALVRTLAWSDPLDIEAARARVIVAPTPHAFGLARMFSSHGEDTRPSLHVVGTFEHALAVLGVIKSEFQPLE
ncbi:MAG TPA: hypothetical protein VJR23_00225 [Candidatus Acidoferrales bacterium]|nr:hypothetical protein [Candidatus Acidoferrales bacterium]